MNSSNRFDVKAERGITEWVARHLQGKVLQIKRQRRWRPCWFVEADARGALLKLYFRGDRAMESGMETTLTTLRDEYEILKVLDANGIPVPHLHGWCDQPRAIVMVWVDGEPYQGGADSDIRLRKLIEEYIDILAKIHSIDIEQFVKAGVHRPDSTEAAVWGCLGSLEKLYDSANLGPQPMVEFLRVEPVRNSVCTEPVD